jgi:uncharacterized ParB-like nuclease family protein
LKLKIDSIQTEAGTQTRAKINEDAVTEYAEAMENGAEFPPVTVFHDGTDYWMADGFHRIMAASRNGFVDIEAEVRKGTKRDALIYALGANTANGLRRTNDDKRRCVEIALKEFPDWSDRRIAEACGVGNQLVGVVRSELQLCDSHSCQTLKRIGRDGKARSTPTPRESRGWTAPEVAQAKERQIEGGKSKVPQQSGEPISGVDKRDLDTDHRLAKEAGQ